MSTSSDIRVFEVPEVLAGARLDRALAELMADVSRSRVQRWIQDGRVRIDQALITNQRAAVQVGQQIEVDPIFEAAVEAAPEAIALDVVHEDPDCLVINKPPGLVVHPGAGQPRGTLQNALLHFDPRLQQLPRAGLIHRLDKLTSGLLVIARHPDAYHRLSQAMQAREISRQYQALVWGRVIAGDRIEAPLGRHPQDRTRFTVRRDGRHAVTHYRVRSRWAHHSLLDVRLETGRTHQIRVHLRHQGFPIVGDPQYGRRGSGLAGAGDRLQAQLSAFRRQALHAFRLGFEQPMTGDRVELQAPLPADLRSLIEALGPAE
ncbi:MAG: RluA family pseudouridine synthase [Abyssibacter sp.]|uniref:RluA family pseudouridine synthase n=1 Tax=Abyssibacter sp. TaxID=2320200 RepID=UPI00321BBCA6